VRHQLRLRRQLLALRQATLADRRPQVIGYLAIDREVIT